MAGRLCDDYANILAQAAMLVAGFTAPTHLYIALSTADPLADGSALTEPSGSAYARVIVDAWTPTARGVENTNDITFPTATGAWGTITHAAILDDSGNFVWSGPLSASQVIDNGITFVIPAGDADVSFT